MEKREGKGKSEIQESAAKVNVSNCQKRHEKCLSRLSEMLLIKKNRKKKE